MPIGFLIVIAFLAVIIGGIAFMAPILSAISQRLAGSISHTEVRGSDQDLIRLQEALNDLERRVRALQDQHDFLEKLVGERSPERLAPPDDEQSEEA